MSATECAGLSVKIVAVFLWVLLYVLTGAFVCVLGRVLFGYLLFGEPLSWGAWRWPHVVDWALVSWLMFAWTRGSRLHATAAPWAGAWAMTPPTWCMAASGYSLSGVWR